MDVKNQDILELLRSNQNLMLEQLHQWCNINSSSFNLKGLAAIADLLKIAFKPIVDSVDVLEPLPFQTYNMSGQLVEQHCGNSLLFRKRPDLKQRILLGGHMDTVYPKDSHFQSLSYLSENCIKGPGVSDMKGGLIVMLHALTAFELTAASKNIGWDVLINADEEIGSPTSAYLLSSIGANYAAALIYEPAMDSTGTLAKNRKGSGGLTIIATGVAAHAGRAFNEGRNAICYLAEVLLAIHALNEHDNGITINIGKIAGGDAVNVVPDKAVAKLDIRITHPDDESWVRAKIDDILQKFKRDDYSLSIAGQFGRPVKVVSAKTEKLFQELQKSGQDLGLTISWKDSGGCCDGNNLAQTGIPVLDTLGVRGGNIHSDSEYILVDSLVERASLSALFLSNLAKTDFGVLSS